jgi:hypothetical protein
MKAKNFRIGNLVKYDNRVFAIHTLAEEFPTLDTIEFGIGVVDWNNLEPYKIKRDNLVVKGFRETYKSDFRIKYEYEADTRLEYTFDIVNNYNYMTFIGVNIPCESYHQMQNVFFALTGQELDLMYEPSTCG